MLDPCAFLGWIPCSQPPATPGQGTHARLEEGCRDWSALSTYRTRQTTWQSATLAQQRYSHAQQLCSELRAFPSLDGPSGASACGAAPAAPPAPKCVCRSLSASSTLLPSFSTAAAAASMASLTVVSGVVPASTRAVSRRRHGVQRCPIVSQMQQRPHVSTLPAPRSLKGRTCGTLHLRPYMQAGCEL